MGLLRLFLPLLLAATAVEASARGEPFETTQTDELGFFFFRIKPAKANPADQFAHARQLLAEGQERAAAKQLDYLVRTWPGAPEAAEAQLLRARVLQGRGKHEEAFDAYQKLITRYANEAESYTTVLSNQYTIAQIIEGRRSGGLGLFKGFSNPTRAIPFYELITTNAPAWEVTPAILVRIGEIQREHWRTEQAIATFNRLIASHPNTPQAEQGAYLRALCSYEIALEHPNHEADTRQAWADATFYLTRFPERSHTEEAMRMQAEMHSRLARFAFEKAEFYERVVRKPAAALAAYEALVRDFQNSKWSEQAKERIRELRQSPSTGETSHEKS